MHNFVPHRKLEEGDLLNADSVEVFVNSMKRHYRAGGPSKSISPKILRGLGEPLMGENSWPKHSELATYRLRALEFLMTHPEMNVRKQAELSYLKFSESEYPEHHSVENKSVGANLIERLGRVVEGDPWKNQRLRLLLKFATGQRSPMKFAACEKYFNLCDKYDFGFIDTDYLVGDFELLSTFIQSISIPSEMTQLFVRTFLKLLSGGHSEPIVANCLSKALGGTANFDYQNNAHFKKAFHEYFEEPRAVMGAEKVRVFTQMTPMCDELMRYVEPYKDDVLSLLIIGYLEREVAARGDGGIYYQSILSNLAKRHSLKIRGTIASNPAWSWLVFSELLEVGLPLFSIKAIRSLDAKLYLERTPKGIQEMNLVHLQRFAKNAPNIGEEIRSKGLLD